MVGCDSTSGPRTGILVVNVIGLPTAVPAAVTIIGPGSATLVATTTTTFPDLPPGKYRITATNTSSDKSTFAPAALSDTVEVLASTTATQVTVSYTVISAILSISITGVPVGVTPSVTLSGTNGFSKTINSSGEIGYLVPGAYSIAAANVDAEELYAGSATPATLTLSASTDPVVSTVTYTPVTGSVRLTSSGLPNGALPTWELVTTGIATRTASGNGEVVVSHLTPAQYTVSARNVAYQGDTYAPSTPSVSLAVVAGKSAAVSTQYALRPTTLNLVIDGAYLTQSVQTYGGGVPLVAGRNAYLRVFVRANESNSISPSVRLRIYRTGSLVATQSIAAPRASVSTTVSQQGATDAWATVVSGSLLQPGASFLVDVDPESGAKETSKSDNQFPVSGTPKALEVRPIPVANFRFVPIATRDGLLGDVTSTRTSELLSLSLRMHPLAAATADVRSTYTTTLQLAQNDSNNAWSRILSELDALRVAEGTGKQYLGILHDRVGGSKWAGVAYIGGRALLSLDATYASETIAHELGHNWGRLHAPCGGPDFVDSRYPYVGGRIGVYGYDESTGRILPPDVPDVMSYCWLPLSFNITNPRQWASDYTYAGVMNYRATSGDVAPTAGAEQQCLILWGRITAAGLLLEPAFVARTRPSLPAKTGRFSVRAIDERGSSLVSLSFEPQSLADADTEEAHFAFAVPLDGSILSRISSLVLTGGGRRPTFQVAKAGAESPPLVKLTSPRPGLVRLQWDQEKRPLLVVRDPQTQQIISFARGGDALVRTRSVSPTITASDGVQTITMQVRQ